MGTPARSPHRDRRTVIAAAAGLLVLSALIVLWAHTRPGFDPYGWLSWGRQTISWSLNTNAAPSWKPLPYLFTVPFALAGHVQVILWLITAVAISLSGVVFAARIANHLTAAPPERRWAGWVAGAFAGITLLGIQNYSHYILSAQSDPMIVALCLGAIDCHLNDRPRWAFALGALAGLGRPEVWAPLGLYGLWLWRVRSDLRLYMVGVAVAMAALWFGIPALTSRSPFVAGDNALGSVRALHSNKIGGTVQRYLDLHALPLEIAALLSFALAAWRRDRAVLLLCAGVVLWVLVEVGFALRGWPGLARYLFEASGVTVVIAAVLVGRLLAGPLPGVPLPAWAGALLVAVLIGALVPTAISRARDERTDLAAQRTRTDQINRLATAINAAGGAKRLLACGEPLTMLEYQSILSWSLNINVARIGWKFPRAIASGRPIVLFTPTSRRGWRIRALHQHTASCLALPH